MDTKQYLKRIQYTGELNPTLETLRNLQVAHLLTVPFENLDIHLHIEIKPESSFDKIVIRNRGGFCYELNNLFFDLLKNLGFNIKLVSARVFDKEKGFGPEFDHMAIIATFQNDQYLADVGFGEFSFYPLKIELDKEQIDPRGIFYMEKYNDEHLLVKKKDSNGDYLPEYLFSEKERKPDEFREMLHFHQTSNQSHFTQKRICSLPLPQGRMTLTDKTLKSTYQDTIITTELADEATVKKVLKEYFKIEL